MLFAFTFLFESWIYERRLTLGLNHGLDFTNLSKPVRPPVFSFYYNQRFRDRKGVGGSWEWEGRSQEAKSRAQEVKPHICSELKMSAFMVSLNLNSKL